MPPTQRVAVLRLLPAIAFLSCSFSLQALEPLPVQIPSSSTAVADLVKQSATAVEQINDLDARIRILARILYDLRGLPRDQLQPLVVLLTREAANPDNQRLIVELLGALQSNWDIILPIVRRWPDVVRREYALAQMVGAIGDVELAQEVVNEIKSPERQAIAHLSLLHRARTFPEAKEWFAEMNRRGWPPNQANRVRMFTAVLGKFIPEHFDEIVIYVRSEMSSDEARETFGYMARNFELYKKQPEIAARFRSLIATPPIPEQLDAAGVSKLLLRGYARHDPQRALELFDEYVRPTIKADDDFSTIASLAPAGIGEVMSRAESAAAGDRFRHIKVGQALKECIRFVGPDPVLKWLRDAPQSLTRDTAIEIVTGHLAVFVGSPTLREVSPQQLVDELSLLVLQIASPFNRRKASERLIRLALRTSTPVPTSFHDEFLRLFKEHAAALRDDDRKGHYNHVYELLPTELQLDAIERMFHTSDLQTRANLVRRSSLSAEQKKSLLLTFLAETRTLADPRQRANAFSGLGGDLWELEPQRAMPLLWESLALARQLGLKPIPPNIDDGPGYHGYHYPPTDANEALGPAIQFRPGNEAAKADALWEFAGKLDDQADREAVLEALGNLLVKQNEYQKAAGLAFLLDAPLRRARLLTAIAVAQSGNARAD